MLSTGAGSRAYFRLGRRPSAGDPASPRARRAQRWTRLSIVLLLCTPSLVVAHSVYVMNSNHTDYNWNAPAAVYDVTMAAELDFYLQQIAATQGEPFEEQARYTPDNWYYLWLYENNRTPAEFSALVDAMRSGHITIPLNPFVTLYGALTTEAAIRAGYYPGRMMRKHGIQLLLGENIENQTSPWGLASVWAGSGARYTWKGVCGCVTSAPARQDDELFIWEGPDGKTVLFKWYELLGSNQDWGGYSEARQNLTFPSQLDAVISLSSARMPGISATGLFGAGWDDVSWESTAVLDAVKAYNATATGDVAVVSNGIDFFQDLEATGETSLLNVLRGGWGNDWDQWPASLAERTSRARRAMERMRLAEAMAALVQVHDKTFWPPVQSSLETGLVSAWKYFEHAFAVTTGGPSLAQLWVDKETWVQDLEASVDGAVAAAESALAGLVTTPDADTILVFNPLGFQRTDVVELVVAQQGPYVVTDAETLVDVPTQMVERDGVTYLQFLAEGVPSVGYRTYFFAPGTPPSVPLAAVVSPAQQSIENDLYRVVLGPHGELDVAVHKVPDPAVQLAGPGGLNELGTGLIVQVAAENVGPVSATLRLDLTFPASVVRVTLYAGVDRIDIEATILENIFGTWMRSFDTNLPGAQIRFEEIAGIARPGLVTEGGDFLPGTRASRMTLNHFVDFALPAYHMVISNRDAYSMQVNDSTNETFDLIGDEISVIVAEQARGAQTTNQAGDDRFLNRFAIRGIDAPFDAAESMRTALAHQNPLHAVQLPRNQAGPITARTDSLVSFNQPNVVLAAFKPGEDPNSGFVLRAWEMGGAATQFPIQLDPALGDEAWETSLIETNEAPATLTAGVLAASIEPNEIQTWRLSTKAGPRSQAAKDPSFTDVVLTWSEGTPPFVVRRTTDPGLQSEWETLTPYGGTMDYFWVDPGVLDDPVNYYYEVLEPR